MRATIFILFLSSFFCFGSGQAVQKRVAIYSSFLAQDASSYQNQNDLVGNANLHAMVSSQTELFLVEESCNTDEAPQTFFALKSEFIKKNYALLVATIIVKDNAKGSRNFQSFYGYSQPIYISQRVLRI